MTQRILAAAVMAALVLGACGKSGTGTEPTAGETEGQTSACPPAPSALAAAPELPQSFPIPAELTLTSEKEAGPSTIIEGYWESDLNEVYEEYQAAFEPAGYDVTFNEKEENDAEVNFAGENTTGQVKLEVECEGRTHVRITIRPA